MSKNIFYTFNIQYLIFRHVKILRAVCRSRLAPLPPSCRVEEKVIIIIMMIMMIMMMMMIR